MTTPQQKARARRHVTVSEFMLGGAPLDPVTMYAVMVLTGVEVAGPYVRGACQRHLNDMKRGRERGLWFDLDEMNRIFRFFSERLRLTEGQFEGETFKLHPSQQFILGSIYGWQRKNREGLTVRRFQRVYIEMGKGNGKALALDTPIATPTGWSTMGDLRPGDTVFDDTGAPCKVTAVSGHMVDRPCYRVRFNDGSEIVADADHLWRTTPAGVPEGQKLRTTLEIAFTVTRLHCVDHRWVSSCEPVPSVPVQCISVDSPSRMFLAGRTMIPTHNSPMVGGMGLYGMVADMEPGAQIYSCGATYDQANILFQDAVKMAQAVPDWNDEDDPLITFSGNQKVYNMAVLPQPQAHSFFRPISRMKGKTGSGPRPHMALCDELHEHPDGGVIEMLERGFKFRRQPLLIMITNSGSDRRSVCWAEHEHARKIVEFDVEDDKTFSYVCALDEDDKPFEDQSCWKKANPLLGVTITEEYLEGVVQQALQIAGKQNNILRLHFCNWTDSATAWISRKRWEACEDPDLTRESMRGRKAYGGLDLSQTKDLTAKAWAFDDGWKDVPELDQDMNPVPGRVVRKPCYALIVDSYTPEETLQARQEVDRAPYDQWVESGHLKPTPGPVIRLDIVAKDLVDDHKFFDVAGVAYDAYLVREFKTELDAMNAPDIPMHDHPQGTSYRQGSDLFMPRSVDTFETLILEGRLRVEVNPVLRTAVAGAVFWKSPAGLKRFTKDKATNRIDPAVAAAMAIGLATANEVDVNSVWNKLGAEHAQAEAAKAEASVTGSLVNGEEIDYSILNDREHPLHSAMVKRWNDQQEQLGDDDDD